MDSGGIVEGVGKPADRKGEGGAALPANPSRHIELTSGCCRAFDRHRRRRQSRGRSSDELR